MAFTAVIKVGEDGATYFTDEDRALAIDGCIDMATADWAPTEDLSALQASGQLELDIYEDGEFVEKITASQP